MRFAKSALTIDEQVDLLLSRGMEGDRGEMRERLRAVSYYRLSGYWYHRKQVDDAFEPGTRFGVVWNQYVFDRKLRLLVMDAIERIEVALRTQLSYHHAHAHGPFGYASDPESLPNLNEQERKALLKRITEEVGRSKEAFVVHFREKYGDAHELLPVWMATEVMTLGTIAQIYKASSKQVANPIATSFDVSNDVLRTWLWSLNEVRNIVAHHGRLWNRELGNKPMIPREKHHPEWHTPVPVPNRRVFAVLCICSHCLMRIAPNSLWRRRVKDLVAQSPDSPLLNMGIPGRWLESPLWKGDVNGG